MPYARVDGIRLYYDDYGPPEATPLLIVPGLDGNALA